MIGTSKHADISGIDRADNASVELFGHNLLVTRSQPMSSKIESSGRPSEPVTSRREFVTAVTVAAAVGTAGGALAQTPAKPLQSYDKTRTALLFVDPYNDFLSEGGKNWPRVKDVALEVGLLDNLRAIRDATRRAGIKIFIVPHHRWDPGDYESWNHPSPSQVNQMKNHFFARGEWGGEWHPDFAPQAGDIVVKEHWGQSGFANTDLDQQLKQHGVSHVIVVGLLANTCVESTGRFAMELGYHVTLVRDATAAATKEMMHAAHDLNGPSFAHAILKTSELIAALPSA
jgi:nicotinamidase-related amidase